MLELRIESMKDKFWRLKAILSVVILVASNCVGDSGKVIIFVNGSLRERKSLAPQEEVRTLMYCSRGCVT